MQTLTRRQTKKQAVLAELLAARGGRTYDVPGAYGHTHRISDGWVPATTLYRLGGARFVARLSDLKDEGALGYESRHLFGSVWGYRATRFEFA